MRIIEHECALGKIELLFATKRKHVHVRKQAHRHIVVHIREVEQASVGPIGSPECPIGKTYREGDSAIGTWLVLRWDPTLDCQCELVSDSAGHWSV